MARVDAEVLSDLADLLTIVRGWDGVEERSYGTFYCRRQPFLHFHAGAAGRRADVKTAAGWVQVQLQQPLPEGATAQLLSVLETEHVARCVSQPRPI